MKKKIGKIGKKKTKKRKTGRYVTPLAHSLEGGELNAKEEGKERKEKDQSIKSV